MFITGLLDAIRQTDQYASLLNALRTTQAPSPQHLPRAARAYITAALANDLKTPIVFLTGRVDRAHNLAEQLPVWSDQYPSRRFAEPSTIFYERAPWSMSAIHNRLAALNALIPPVAVSDARPPSLVVASAYAVMQKTLPVREFRAHTRLLKVGGRAEPESLLRTWLQIGYTPASIVVEPGTFSRRGGIVDVYPVAAQMPVRIEFFGDEIESLRLFHPGTQRSSEAIEQVIIGPAREALPRYAPRVAETLSDWFASQPEPVEDVTSSLPDHALLETGTAFPLLEFYLPYLYSQPANLIDYVPEDALIVIDDAGALHDSIADLEEQSLAIRDEKLETGQLPPDYPIPYVTWAELEDQLSTRRILYLGAGPGHAPPNDPTLGKLFAPGQRYGGQLRLVMDALGTYYDKGETTVVVTQQAQRLAEVWSEQSAFIHPVSRIDDLDTLGTLTFVEGSLAEGWSLQAANSPLHLYTDAELFGWRRPEPRRRAQPRTAPPESGFADLDIGDYVVHIEYGIGRFGGLQKRVIDDVQREYLVIEYAGTDTLYVPIHQADRLSRYVGADDRPPQLNKLGSQEWNRTKQTTQHAVEEVARELLDLYAARSQIVGHAFSPDTPWQHELEASFPYIETNDQLQALAEVKRDMQSPQPMDRLICGDVGYGKTEVALRAAFKAVMDGKQVAVLVPTTVLAQQHYNTFTQRLLPFPVKVEMLSRFRNPSEQRRILYELADGQIDIIIGTHRLLQSDVQVKDLGLLIIDEEQRFGVTHKERFKELRTEVNVLTLTATPIPRTLYMSLTGVRDISMIQTPPEERLPVITHVGVRNDSLIRQAILREVDRGGQVFFVHNRVQTIRTTAEKLQRLVPEASFAIAHGQMDEAQLEQSMTAFARGDHDVLVSTSIIESGLDIPNANTLIVDRADWFGLAQLYQIRGRVGRGANQAYAYFFHPRSSRLTAEARARLDTINEQTGLGAGLSIAMRDLEIRGAGDMLGTRQSGHIAAVGFHLYTQLLAQAVRHLKGLGEAPTLTVTSPTVTIDLPLPAYLPPAFIADTALRIQMYRRMAEIQTIDQLEELESELADRFGDLPRAVQGLLFQLRTKLLAQNARVTAISTENGQISLRLPYLANTDRNALRQNLGYDNLRVSRTAIWIPHAGVDGAVWQSQLLDVLKNLQIEHVQTTP